MSKEHVVKMRTGSSLSFARNSDPAIRVIPHGKRAYLWIGNEKEHEFFCFATLSGEKTLRKLANAILDQVGRRDV